MINNQNHDQIVDKTAQLLKVLGNSTRLHILFFIQSQTVEVSVGQIVEHLRVAQPIVSKQLGILSQYKLVQKHKVGTHVYYSLTDDDVVMMINALSQHAEHL